MVRDHFKDVMMQRRNTFPTGKLFMDKNGFRHFWKGLEIIPNLRKNIQAKNISRNTRKQPNRKKKVLEKVFLPNIMPKQMREGSNLVKTTFFCPFFGIMTMLTDVNMEVEEPKQE
ncbi:unnamed protein product [Pieris macdunnoughi]|uniref:Uncharacterized protein n=1 Tax=Pieris macdunnoughi TaxID=345717 RepID=A0A821XHV9_9NEOP|nr:unnamed protein product [Pieris macdunnoughi]